VLGLFVLHHVKQIEEKKTNHQAESIENELWNDETEKKN
jgi:hypothetical protein